MQTIRIIYTHTHTLRTIDLTVVYCKYRKRMLTRRRRDIVIMIKSSQVYDTHNSLLGWTINEKCALTLTQICWPIYWFAWSLSLPLFVQIQIAEDQHQPQPQQRRRNIKTLVNDAHVLKTGTESQRNRKFFVSSIPLPKEIHPKWVNMTCVFTVNQAKQADK